MIHSVSGKWNFSFTCETVELHYLDIALTPLGGNWNFEILLTIQIYVFRMTPSFYLSEAAIQMKTSQFLFLVNGFSPDWTFFTLDVPYSNP